MEEELFSLCSSLSEPTEEQVEKLNQTVKRFSNCSGKQVNNQGFTPLELLCKNNSNPKLKHCIEILLGINKTSNNENDWYAVFLEHGTFNTFGQSLSDIRKSFGRTYSLNKDDDKELLNGTKALLYFSRNYRHDDWLEIIQLLIEQTQIDFHQNNFGELLFRKLLKHSRLKPDKKPLTKIIWLLIQAGVNVNSRDENGQNALHELYQFYGGEIAIEIVEMLLESGVDVNEKDKFGFNAFHYLLRFNESSEDIVEMAGILVENGIDVNATDAKGLNPLHYLFRFYKRSDGLLELLEILIEKGVDVNAKDSYEGNALHFLFRFYRVADKVEIAKLLIENGVNLNAKDISGCNALHYLFQYDHDIGIAKMMLENGADANAKNKNGRNALHFLFISFQKSDGVAEIVRMLIEKGVHLNVKDNYGNTPLHYLMLHYKGDDKRELEKKIIYHGMRMSKGCVVL